MPKPDSIGSLVLSEARFMHVTLRNTIEAYSRAHDLKPAHLYVLGLLSHSDGQTYKQLGKAAHMLPSNLSPLCSLLESRGYVQRERDKTDGRSSHLHLTTAGTALLDGFDSWLDQVLSCAGPENEKLHEDIRLGFSAFHKLVDIAKAQPSENGGRTADAEGAKRSITGDEI